jgi:hypothetical protein
VSHTDALLFHRFANSDRAHHGTNTYRVSVPEDADPRGGIWISLSPGPKYTIEKYDTAIARVGGRKVRLTKAEAKEMRGVIATAMRLRAIPWHFESERFKPKPQRRSRTRQSTRGASNGGKIRSPMGSTDPDASENAA